MQAVETLFMQHVSEYGLSYGTVAEYEFTLKQFKAVNEEVETFNSQKGTSTIGHNFMSTWT